ncbi:MAG: hypothetical protein NTX79_03480 [Candidatus Micrarchaeota archaeon]|nr:hypothetical protein [Candidatus Micrarchaeota archaeon]
MNGRLSDLRSEIMQAVRHAKDYGDCSLPIAILASETSLRYRFNIRNNVILKQIDAIRKELPSDMWIAVAFSAFVRKGLSLSNMGYFFTKENLLSQPKRRNPDGDIEQISKFLDNDFARFKNQNVNAAVPSPYDIHMEKAKNGKKLADVNESYCTLTTPNGLTLEYRVCADIWEVPNAHKDAITLVSAWGLEYSADGLFAKRPLIVINDSIVRYSLVPKTYINNVEQVFPTDETGFTSILAVTDEIFPAGVSAQNKSAADGSIVQPSSQTVFMPGLSPAPHPSQKVPGKHPFFSRFKNLFGWLD